ncbi:hypothetical protein B566_EDAN004704 [Ephemera danica]|nr:hypothetical protein B566_EDAN004704 [Ephemera danica]
MTASKTSDPESTSYAPLLALILMVRETSKLKLEALQDLPSTPLVFALVYLPAESTVQAICDVMTYLASINHEILSLNLNFVLSKSNKFTERKSYQRLSYCKENYKCVIQPIEILLGRNEYGEEDSYHYISIEDTLKSVLSNKIVLY